MGSWYQRKKELPCECCFRILVSQKIGRDRGVGSDIVPAGFGYSFFNKGLNDYYGAIGLEEFTGNEFDVLTQPLVNQPGSRWEYGINIDWYDEKTNSSDHQLNFR